MLGHTLTWGLHRSALCGTSPAGSSGLGARCSSAEPVRSLEIAQANDDTRGAAFNSTAQTPFPVPRVAVRLGSLGLGETLEEAGRWGSSNAASFSRIGSQKGLVC